MSMSRRNEDAYGSRLLPWLYGRSAPFLQPDEQTVLARYDGSIRGRRVLDIGVGAGRTTAFLAPLADEYLGIDFSPRMAALAAARNPDARIVQGDARDLHDIAPGTIDFALFSNCGLDSLSPEDRDIVFAAVRRVLMPSGLFVFGVHNRGSLPVPKPWSLAHFRHASSVRNLIRRSLLWPVGIANWVRFRRAPVEGPGYVVVHDAGEGLYSYYTLYTTAADQRRALQRAGFRLLDLIDMRGETATEAAIDAGRDVWFTCVAAPD